MHTVSVEIPIDSSRNFVKTSHPSVTGTANVLNNHLAIGKTEAQVQTAPITVPVSIRDALTIRETSTDIERILSVEAAVNVNMTAVRVDCPPLDLQVCGAQTDSNYSIKGPGSADGMRADLNLSARSKASVVKEIEKLTKFTEAQISAGIQIQTKSRKHSGV